MKKWWRRDRRIYVDPTEGREAVQAMREAQDRWPEVNRLSAALAQQGRNNNFRRRFQAEFERGRGQ